MTMARTVVPEELDNLDPVDPYAIKSRSDLKRIHRAMGTCSLLTRELSTSMGRRAAQASPLRVLELGAGDGSLMLRVARSLQPQWQRVQLTLLDQANLLDAKTRAAYAAVGWTVTPQVMDVLDWARDQTAQSAALPNGPPAWDLIVASLFLHHFEAADLQQLLAAIAQNCSAFVACEPRRSRFALAASHCVGALGACSVTRADAVTSVHAGFAGGELSALWPKVGDGWRLSERTAAPFSHCFTAQRSAIAQAD